MIRVMICDDQWIVCEGLEAILSADREIEVVAVAHDGAEALARIPTAKPDVVLMDLKMPGMDGLQATRQICSGPWAALVKVLVLTTYEADEWVFEAIQAGAAGYLLKGTPRESLIEAVKGTAAGRTHVDPSVAGKLFERIVQNEAPRKTKESKILDALSERELDVLRLVARGYSNPDIARRLYLSEGTVRNYVSAILTKLNVPDRTRAAVLALRYGLVKLSEL
jgi:DNA-binding NarL/FixJ family response regulator